MVTAPKWIGIQFAGPLVRGLLREEAPKDVTRRTSDRWVTVKPGDRLWVRETFALGKRSDAISPTEVGRLAVAAGYAAPWSPVWYRADDAFNHAISPRDADRDFDGRGRWRPSIHLPRWASRISLEVVSVRRERGWVYAFAGGERVPLPMVDDEEARREGVADRAAFLDLWHQINGPEYPSELWRIEFRRILE